LWGYPRQTLATGGPATKQNTKREQKEPIMHRGALVPF